MEPVIEIRRGEKGFVVAVVPPDPNHAPKCFEDKRTAYGWASGLKMVTGWRKLDLTEVSDG